MSAAPRITHLISPRLDPIFAFGVGLAAAATRIRREEREKGRGVEESWGVLRRSVSIPEALLSTSLLREGDVLTRDRRLDYTWREWTGEGATGDVGVERKS